MTVLRVSLVVAALALGYAAAKARWLSQQPEGSERLQRLGDSVRAGVESFLRRLYQFLFVVLGVGTALLASMAGRGQKSALFAAAAFVTGGLSSILTGYAALVVASRAGVRVAAAARRRVNAERGPAFAAAAVCGLVAAGGALLGVAGTFVALLQLERAHMGDPAALSRVLWGLSGFVLGACVLAVVMGLGGGIYASAAPSPPSRATLLEAIAERVGDAVGPVGGASAQLMGIAAAAVLAAMTLGAPWFGGLEALASGAGSVAILLPLFVAAAGVLAGAAGLLVAERTGHRPSDAAFPTGAMLGAALTIGFGFAAVRWLVPRGAILVVDPLSGRAESFRWSGVMIALAAGMVAGMATSVFGRRRRVGALISGGAAMLVGHRFAGLWGVGLANLGMISTAGVLIAAIAHGGVARSARGIANMASLAPETRARLTDLEAEAAAIVEAAWTATRTSGALTSVALVAAFFAALGGRARIDLTDPRVLGGLLAGALFFALASTVPGAAAEHLAAVLQRAARAGSGDEDLEPAPSSGRAHERLIDGRARGSLLRATAVTTAVIAAIVGAGASSVELLVGALVGATVASAASLLAPRSAGSEPLLTAADSGLHLAAVIALLARPLLLP